MELINNSWRGGYQHCDINPINHNSSQSTRKLGKGNTRAENFEWTQSRCYQDHLNHCGLNSLCVLLDIDITLFPEKIFLVHKRNREDARINHRVRLFCVLAIFWDGVEKGVKSLSPQRSARRCARSFVIKRIMKRLSVTVINSLPYLFPEKVSKDEKLLVHSISSVVVYQRARFGICYYHVSKASFQLIFMVSTNSSSS